MSNPFVGEIRMFAGNFAPTGYALCDGRLLPISSYDALFALIGTTYGGDGQSTFGLPDLRGRVPLHQGSGNGLSTRVIGEQLGEQTVTLTVAQLPLHSHSLLASTNATAPAYGPGSVTGNTTPNSIYGGAPQVAMAAAAVTSTGGGQPHDNLAPYQALNFIIALFGIFPSRN